MDWKFFENKFHKTWHSFVKKWIESNECNKVYTFLKSQKGKEIAPKSTFTFRSFKQPLTNVKVVVYLEEPYCEKYNENYFADGIPLSCEYVDKMHPQLNEFYNAMEREFYDLNLNTIKEKDLTYLTNQGVLFLSSSLTVEINKPKSHKGLWISFNKFLIQNVFNKKQIPIIFCGKNVYEEYKSVMDPIFPYYMIEESLNDWKPMTKWNTNGKFLKLNEYLWNDTDKDDIMWVKQDVPF